VGADFGVLWVIGWAITVQFLL